MTVTRADREVAVACEYGDDWRSWLSDRRIVDVEAYIEGHRARFSRDHAAERIAAYRVASTQALREAAERLCVEVERLRLGGWVANAKSAAIALRSALAALEPKP
jgi:hypothetical protein